MALYNNYVLLPLMAQPVRAAEYTDCISTEGRDLSSECPVYDTKLSDGEVLVILELWGMQSTPSMPSLLCALYFKVIAPDRVLSMDQIELFYIWTVYLY